MNVEPEGSPQPTPFHQPNIVASRQDSGEVADEAGAKTDRFRRQITQVA